MAELRAALESAVGELADLAASDPAGVYHVAETLRPWRDELQAAAVAAAYEATGYSDTKVSALFNTSRSRLWAIFGRKPGLEALRCTILEGKARLGVRVGRPRRAELPAAPAELPGTLPAPSPTP